MLHGSDSGYCGVLANNRGRYLIDFAVGWSFGEAQACTIATNGALHDRVHFGLSFPHLENCNLPRPRRPHGGIKARPAWRHHGPGTHRATGRDCGIWALVLSAIASLSRVGKGQDDRGDGAPVKALRRMSPGYHMTSQMHLYVPHGQSFLLGSMICVDISMLILLCETILTSHT